MTAIIFSATGCARCKITKKFLQERSVEYLEFDIKAEGKEEFAKFYRENRNAIFRDKDGVEFPVFTDGKVIRQGVSVIISYLIAGDGLQKAVGRSELHGEWIDGFNVSCTEPGVEEELLTVLGHLKKSGLKIQVATTGKNSTLLKSLLEKSLVDRVIMEVRGPASLYPTIAGEVITEEELRHSIQLTCSVPEYRLVTTITPFFRNNELLDFITPEEVGETAKFIEDASGSKKHPYLLRPFNPQNCVDERFASIEPLPSSALFKYRTAARRYQVMTDIEK